MLKLLKNRQKVLFKKRNLKNRKKAQVTGQIFIYVIAAVIFAFIMLYGYQSLRDINDKSCKVGLISFKTDIENSIKGISSSLNEEKRGYRLPANCGYDEVCFIDTAFIPFVNGTPAICDQTNITESRPLICNAWKDGPLQNVFTLPDGDLEINVGTIELDDHYLCVKNRGGKVKLRLIGMGDRVKIIEDLI